MTHLVWMTLPAGDAAGRGERVKGAVIKLGLEPHTAVALKDDGGGDVVPSETSATLADAFGSFDKGVGGEDVGWRASAGEASVVVGPYTVGERRGLIVRFMQSDFEELDSAIRGGRLLDLIASLRGTCGGKEVIWARDMSPVDLVEILDTDAEDLSPGDLDHVAAVAEVGEGLSGLMEVVGDTAWGGSLRFVARKWAQPKR